jgi:uncharacterized protein (TIRG00374 family)
VIPIKHSITILIGFAVSGGSLWLAAHNINWGETVIAIKTLQLNMLTLAVISLITGLFLRAERWCLIISRPVKRISIYHATFLGFFFNYIYPARAGDVIKILGLQRSSGISIGWLGLSGIIDRLSDILVLLCSAVALIKLLPSTNLSRDFFFFAWTGLLLFVFVCFSPLSEILLKGIDNKLIKGRPDTYWIVTLKRGIDGLLFFRQGMVHGKQLGKLACALLLVALSDYLSIYFLLCAFGWELSYYAPIVIWVFISAGAALPSAPAGIGIHQLACFMALKLFGISSSEAFALSVILQIASLAAILSSLFGILIFYSCNNYIFNRRKISFIK